MRVLVVLALLSGALPAVCLGSSAATPGPAESALSADASPPCHAPLPVMLWPFALMVGYISIDLKRQLRRRGSRSSKRSETFSDLVSLRDVAAPTACEPPGRDGPSDRHAR